MNALPAVNEGKSLWLELVDAVLQMLQNALYFVHVGGHPEVGPARVLHMRHTPPLSMSLTLNKKRNTAYKINPTLAERGPISTSESFGST